MTQSAPTGQRVGNYRLLEVRGEGGMGTVYLAEHVFMEHQVAIKVLLPEIALEDEMVTRLFDEARMLNRLHHPSLVQVFDCGIAEGVGPYLVMEMMHGEPLSRYLRRHSRPSNSFVLHVLGSVAAALEVAHAAGIVHRDLKPANIFLLAPGGVKLLDFGIARLDISLVSRPRTSAFQTLGTPSYMAPEQCTGEHEIDHRADVYALGVVAFRLLTGGLPYQHENSGQLLVAHQQAPIPRASERSPRLSADVDGVLFQALAKRPSDRFDSCRELVEALTAALDQGAVQSPVSGALGVAGWSAVESELTAPRHFLSEVPPPRSCPHCAVPLTEREYGDIEIDCCLRCNGIWFDGGELEQVTADSLGGELGSEQRLSRVADLCRSIGPTQLACPACGEPLVNHVLLEDEALEIDLCTLCDGVWLDAGELARLQRGQARKLIAQLVGHDD